MGSMWLRYRKVFGGGGRRVRQRQKLDLQLAVRVRLMSAGKEIARMMVILQGQGQGLVC